MEGCGPQPRVYSSAEYETLAAELAKLKECLYQERIEADEQRQELDAANGNKA